MVSTKGKYHSKQLQPRTVQNLETSAQLTTTTGFGPIDLERSGGID